MHEWQVCQRSNCTRRACIYTAQVEKHFIRAEKSPLPELFRLMLSLQHRVIFKPLEEEGTLQLGET